MVTVKKRAVTILADYGCNGLHWRVLKKSNTTGAPASGSASGLSQQRIMYYSASWQLLEEEVFDNCTDSGGPGTQTRRVQTFWGLRYIDDAIAHRVNTSPTSSGTTYQSTWYHLTDVQYSTVALLDDYHNIAERVRYDAYGGARHVWGLDVNGDGYADDNDYSRVKAFLDKAIGDTLYEADLDLNCDGVIDGSDLDLANAAIDNPRPPLGLGQISNPDWANGGPDNEIGYCGYVFNAECGLYTVRFRHYSPEFGRWLEKDPLGYVDGMNLFQYCRGQPLDFTDSLGLAALLDPNHGPTGKGGGDYIVVPSEDLGTREGWAMREAALEAYGEVYIRVNSGPNKGKLIVVRRDPKTGSESTTVIEDSTEAIAAESHNHCTKAIIIVGSHEVAKSMRDFYGPAAIILVIVGLRMADGGEMLEEVFQAAKNALRSIPEGQAKLITGWFQVLTKDASAKPPAGITRSTLETWYAFLDAARATGRANSEATEQVRIRLKLIREILDGPGST